MAERRTREDIAADYQAARRKEDFAGMARFQNEEACLVLLTVLERLAVDSSSFIHRVAIKGGMLMAGELLSPQSVRRHRCHDRLPAPSGRGRPDT